jgi:hypothetical protein
MRGQDKRSKHLPSAQFKIIKRKTKMKVWVLLFNADSENQGIYTRLENDKNIVLAFMQEDDALRYAMLLEAQDFPIAVTESIDEKELMEICEDTGLELNIIGEDELAIPPVSNVEKTDWQENSDNQLDTGSGAGISAEALEIEIMRRKLEGLL